MSKTKILNRIEICIGVMKDTENTFVTRELKEIREELVRQWNESDLYYEEIKQVINE
jgi:hypothetical protein